MNKITKYLLKVPIVTYDNKNMGEYTMMFNLAYIPFVVYRIPEFFNSDAGITIRFNFNIILILMLSLGFTHFVLRKPAEKFVRLFCLLMFSALIFHLLTFTYFVLQRSI